MSSVEDDDSDIDMEDSPNHVFTSEQEKQDEILARSFARNPQMARVLASVPQAVPFEERLGMFESLIAFDKNKMQNPNVFFTEREHISIKRARLFRDSFDRLNHLGSKLRSRIQVGFVNEHGTEEAGIDGGGVFKEFMDDLVKEAFHPLKHKYFAVTGVETLKVNVHNGGMDRSTLSEFEFLGRVLGKAVYESILVEPQFCIPFLKKLLGKQNTVFDLKYFDPEFYNHLINLRKHNMIEEMGLSFEVHSLVNMKGYHLDKMRSVELCPGGSSMQVNQNNCLSYIHLVSHHRLNVEGAQETKAFLRGFQDIIPAPWVRLFSADELQKLFSGDSSVTGIDVVGLKETMVYSGGYHISQPIMGWFWEVLSEMSPDLQRKFLRFMTSCSRQPLLGFKALVPVPCIQQVALSDENGAIKLPSSATCMHLLKLPKYNSKEVLKDKLYYAIESGTGFELS